MDGMVYAYDTQIYVCFDSLTRADTLKSVEVCISDVRSWLMSNRLIFNDSRTEVIHFLLVTVRLTHSPLKIGSFYLNETSVVHDACLQFIQCQLDNSLVHKNSRRYNVITQVMALKSHLISPACYKYLQSLDCLTLPHPKTLQQLFSKFGLESDYSTFLIKATSEFNQKERNLILMRYMSSLQFLIREEE